MPSSSAPHGGHASRGMDPLDTPTVAGPPDARQGRPGDPGTGRSVTDIVDHLFARFDVDGDASITLSEWLGVVRADRADAVAAALAALDGNADGALSRDELTAAVAALDSDGDASLSPTERQAATDGDGSLAALLPGPFGRHGPAAFEPVSVDDALAAVLARFDSDGSDTISVSELLAGLPGLGRHDNAQDTLETALAGLDSDADGGLNAAELDAAFSALDADNDGLLNSGEVLANLACPGNADTPIDLVGVLLLHVDLPGA